MTMTIFQIGETVIVRYTSVKDGVAYDPATSTNVVIYKPDGTVDTVSAAMTRDSLGHFRYPWQTTGKTAGTYRARVTATDGTLITVDDCSIVLAS